MTTRMNTHMNTKLKTKTFKKTALALLVCAGLATGALAGDKCDKGQRYELLAEKLKMTDSQAEQFKQVMTNAKSSRKDMRKQRQEIQQRSDTGDLAGAADLAAKQARERVYQKAEVKQKLAEFLSAEQIEQLKTLHANKSKRHSKRRNSDF